MKTKVAAIVGPTATGKSAIAVAVAAKLDAEIVSVDSMQVYRGMDAGTAKPTADMRARVGHHLVDVVEPAHPLTVAEFQSLARAAIAEISARGRLPLLVGGSGLYFRAVVDDLSFPPQSLEHREDLEEEADRVGPEALHERLAGLDPVAAAKIDLTNTRRIIRALEVIETTGRPFSENARWDVYESIYDLAVAGLTHERPELFHRIEQRVDAMLESGLVDEARRLASEGLSRTARQALGYRQILDDPAGSIDEHRAAIVRATKRFARRQESWFRADPRVQWFDGSAHEVTEELTKFFRGV